MEKTKFEKELEKRSLSNLCRVCEGKGLDYTGNREVLIARLVEWEKSQEPEPEVESPASESETPEPED
ncbi:unnamed protein product [marine sediment metagenome]|uniref:SAP domain-containing protein n=1 Tax=marine sediment metagenome TaxID=412755 RepID=X1IZ96_9ZZZZ